MPLLWDVFICPEPVSKTAQKVLILPACVVDLQILCCVCFEAREENALKSIVIICVICTLVNRSIEVGIISIIWYIKSNKKTYLTWYG